MLTIDIHAFILDQLADAEHAERQAISGPYDPGRGITRASLQSYARDCVELATLVQKASPALARSIIRNHIAGKDGL
jgi:hypothetical protein